MRIYLSRPHMSGKEQEQIAEAFATNFIAPVGPQIVQFEESVNRYLGGGLHCVALSSGSAALHLALRIAGVQRNDEVWVCSMTFAGGVFPINYLGAKPRFFDVDPKTWTIDVQLLEEALVCANLNNCLPKAIVPTDLYGQSVDLKRLELLSSRYEVPLIVDSAESLGAVVDNNRKAGSGGDAAILSFNGNKIITTSGGGMLVTRHEEWARQARFLSTQARDDYPHYEHSTFGYNYRLSNICASIGIAQMRVLDERVLRRRSIFSRYQKELSVAGISFMPELKGSRSTRWLTTMTIDPKEVDVTREDIRLKLLEAGIESRPLWKPMHLQPVYQPATYYGRGTDEWLFKNGLCLPSGSDMTREMQSEVIEAILNML